MRSTSSASSSSNVARTQWFMDQLVKHDLLEPRNIRLEKGGGGKSINLNGLFVVNEEKLRQLDEKVAHEFLRKACWAGSMPTCCRWPTSTAWRSAWTRASRPRRPLGSTDRQLIARVPTR